MGELGQRESFRREGVAQKLVNILTRNKAGGTFVQEILKEAECPQQGVARAFSASVSPEIAPALP
jgi:hypothetical protein